MLFTVSTKPVLSVVFSNIGSTKNVTALGFGQNTQNNLITCRNSELVAGSQYPQTTKSLLKTGLLSFIELLLFLFSR